MTSQNAAQSAILSLARAMLPSKTSFSLLNCIFPSDSLAIFRKDKKGMKRAAGFLAVLAVSMICGCASVSSVEPIGEREKFIPQKEWGGAWIHQGRTIMVKVLDGQKGLLRIAWVDEKSGDLELESYLVEIRESGKWVFGNIKGKEDSDLYSWALLRKDEGQIILWYPDPKQFVKLVQTGVLPGKVEGENVVLEKLTPEHLKVILSEDKGVCFDWKKPEVLFRLGK